MHQIKPIITKQNGNKRPGKGFSPDEIKEAGLDAGSARKLCVPVDRKRRTSHEDNIECLKAHMNKAPAKTMPKPAAAERKKKPKN
jgi:large subunit ribosomal protein L13e